MSLEERVESLEARVVLLAKYGERLSAAGESGTDIMADHLERIEKLAKRVGNLEVLVQSLRGDDSGESGKV